MWKFGIASIASFCVLTGGVAATAALADPPTTAPAGTDKIEGKVVDQAGNPVPNVTVKLYLAKAKHGKKAADPTAVLPGQSAEPLAKEKRVAIQTTTTAGEGTAIGTFSFTGLADGRYVVVAGEKGVGMGHETVVLSATSPDDSTVTITLAPPKAKAAQ